jgi:transposase InsO family protein
VRGIGWEFVHVCLDDCSRLAYAEVLRDEPSVTVAGFLRRAVAWFARRGVVAQRVLSDNGSAYRSRLVAAACEALALGHRFTRPYTPSTNGKAERFIQTMLAEWAYGRIYGSSSERTRQLQPWLTNYNFTRPHGALGHQPPASRLTNVVRNYS